MVSRRAARRRRLRRALPFTVTYQPRDRHAANAGVSLSMRLAAIDIGTNSIHMVVVQVKRRLLVRGRRPREGDGPAGRRRPRRPRPVPGRRGGRAGDADPVQAARRVAGRSRRSWRSPPARCARPGTAGSSWRPSSERTGIRAARDRRHRGGPPHPQGGGLRRGRQQRHDGRRRHRRRVDGGHARHRDRGAPGAQFPARRHPADRPVRVERPAVEGRRAAPRQAHPVARSANSPSS